MDELLAEWAYPAGEGRYPPAGSDVSPTLSVAGFEGPLDFLVEMVRRHRIDLGRLSILALIDQFVAAFAAARPRVTLERRGDWLVMASTLLQLKAQLLWPATPAAAADAEAEVVRQFGALDELARMREAAAWLSARSQLGHDVFPRGRGEQAPSPQAALYVAFLEAILVMLEGRGGEAEAPFYQPVVPDLWRIPDALARIKALLAEHPEGGTLARFLPPIAPDATNRALKARAAVASTFVAGLELARVGQIHLAQMGIFGPVTLHSVPDGGKYKQTSRD